MPLGNPIEAWLQMAQNKNQNTQQMDQDIAGIGQGLGGTLGGIAQIIQQKKKQALMQQLMQQMKNQTTPVQGPQGYAPPNQGPASTSVPVGQIPPMNTQAMKPIMMGLDPQGMIGQMEGSMFPKAQTPLQNTQMDYLKWKMANSGNTQNSSPAAYVDDQGNVSIEPKPGFKPVSKQQLPYVGVSASTKAKNKVVGSRAEAMERGIDARQIDTLAKSVGVTPAQRNLLQQNNMRANRAIELAQKPMTWQEFGAVTTDAAAIMQGGSPQVQQLHDMAYPSWKQTLARAQTYATSTPTANVPEEFKNRVIGMIQGIQKVDNRYLTKNADFMQTMMSPTIRGGVGKFKTPIQDMTNTLTETAGGGQKGPTATGPNGQKVMWNGSQWVPQ